MITREQAQAAADAFGASNGERTKAAAKLGLPYTTFRRHLARAGHYGMLGYEPVVDGFEISSISTAQDADGTILRSFVRQVPEKPEEEFQMPENHTLAAGTFQVRGDGKLERYWAKTKETPDPLAVVEAIKAAFVDYIPSSLKVHATPIEPDADKLLVVPLGDLHIGMFSWGQESGVNWDLKIAERVIGDAIVDVVDQSPECEEGILLIGGDTLHADNSHNVTARSNNPLDVDGRWAKVLGVAVRMMVAAAERMKRRVRRLIIRVLPGNHDEHSAVAIAYYLLAHFRDDPAVEVDIDPSLFFYKEWGVTMIASTHGHMAKPADMPLIMASRKPEMWGRTRFRYAHTFHIHHKSVAKEQGVITETHQTPIPADGWHFGSGFVSGRSVKSIIYSRRRGEIGRVIVAILDDGPADAA
jgi:hypothetical protein